MPDITMCANLECPLSKICRRSSNSGTIPDPVNQSWAYFRSTFVGPSDHEPDAPLWTCNDYLPKKKDTNDQGS
jgi:hypothetical protein